MSSAEAAPADELDGSEIAVIGMACRFPGAATPEAFWANLRDGVESITFLADDELRAAGVAPALLADPLYVKAAPILDDIEAFDAAFFGYAPREATLIDPQQRLFLECASEALEQAGYNPETYDGTIGVYGGAKTSTYLFNLFASRALAQSLDIAEIGLGNDLANLTTRVAYKLNLRGPTYSVHTACSTSLVAVHLACQSLLIDECRMALAGGVAVNVPHKVGYRYQHGGILSPDGHCRAFAADAGGTIFGSGVGIVVLKRLQDALDDGDTIHAVIRGSASNNDGAAKASFTAPGVDGQAEVVAEALANAMLRPEQISYVETHGTGTSLGDSIEIRALARALRGRRHTIPIGSVKTNIGHLDTAAGISSLIKTVLALKHRQIPPSLHCATPSPAIDWARSQFYVNTTLQPWPSDGQPRRAGVSSFGFGSSNAHVILEEAPPISSSPSARAWHLLLLSAKTSSALERATDNLHAHLRAHPEQPLADVAYTLQVGRQTFDQRRVVLCRDHDDASAALETRAPQQVWSGIAETREREVVLLFSGQGAQQPDMGRALYQAEPVFRAAIDRCAELLDPQLGLDLRTVLYPTPAERDAAAQQLDQTWLTQPALFAFEYALARLWQSWGITPAALIGHSIGEYVAATLAGVFSLEDALRLVATRGRLMQALPPGAMLAARVAEPALRPYLEADPALALAAINGPDQHVIAGPSEAIAALDERLKARGIETRRLHTSHAFHSPLMEPIMAPFAAEVARVALQPPTIPLISNVTGDWLTDAEATDPAYWARQLRATVQFAAGLRALFATPDRILLEVGPRPTLSALARQHPERPAGQLVLASAPHALDAQPEDAFLLATAGRLWLAGVDLDWPALYPGEQRRRVPLPTYPFERQRFWIDADAAPGGSAALPLATDGKLDLADWFYLPSWRRALPPASAPHQPRRWLIFVDELGLGARLAERLRAAGHEVVRISAGASFARHDETHYTLDPTHGEDYRALLSELRAAERMPERIVHCWSLAPDERPLADDAALARAETLGFSSLIALLQALGAGALPDGLQLGIVTSQLHDLTGGEQLDPAQALLLGVARVIPQEYPRISCRSIDLMPGEALADDDLLDRLRAEFDGAAEDTVISYRGGHRWAQNFERVRLPAAARGRLRARGVYLITGGLGGVGLILAEHLARSVGARLILVGRTALPPRAEWPPLLATDASSPAARAVERIAALEALGAEVLYQRADVTDPAAVAAAVAAAIARFGTIHGVFHAAGVPGGGLIQLKTPEAAAAVLAPKTRGLLALDTATRDLDLDLIVLFSSLVGVVGEFGQVDYAAANAFMDAFAQRGTRRGRPTIAINWDTWQGTGMAAGADVPAELRRVREQLVGEGILAAEGMAALDLILAQPRLPQILVSTQDLPARIARIAAVTRALVADALAGSRGDGPAVPRPDIQTPYVAPRDDYERTLVGIWQQVLGIAEVGIHDDFFQLGGHSLLITQLLNRLHQAYPVEIPIRSLFANPTVAGMARLVAERDTRDAGGAEQPLAEQIRTAAPGQRYPLLERYFREKVAQALEITPAALPADGDLRALDVAGITSDLMWNLHQDFKLQVYPPEIRQRPAIDALARLVSDELTRLAALGQQSTPPAESPFARFEPLAMRAATAPRHFSAPARRNPPMLFVHSSPRSGSTLFRVMLAGHPALFAPPELDILRCDTVDEWLHGLHDESAGYGFFWATQGLQWAFTQLLGLDDAAAKAYLEQLARAGRTIAEVYAQLQQLSAPRMLVDKSPGYTLRLDTLQRAEQIFDGAKYIHLVRHPYAVIESLVRLRFDKLFGPVIYGSDEVDPHVVAEKVWVLANRNMLQFFGQVASERVHRVRYEDLVRDPEAIMRGVCRFLELPFTPAVLQPYDNRPERMISGLGDPNILRHTAVEAEMAESWRTIRLPYQLGQPARQLAAELGYPLPEQAAPPAPDPSAALLAQGDPDTLAQLLAQVSQLSADEVNLMLTHMQGDQNHETR